MSTLSVDLGERSYPIHIAPGLLTQTQSLSEHIRGERAVIITNDVVSPLWLDRVLASMTDKQVDVICIPDGEQYKTLQQFESVITQLMQMHAARDTTLVALGGGVIGDLTGFVAASFQRGMPFIQVPTTLLSQVDSSVGGKTAVNHPLGKNMIGAFYQPKAVLIDTDTLATLPNREFSAGMAEVIKYGIIYDADFYTWLELNADKIEQRDSNTLTYLIRRCCEVKAQIVALDERESGIRALLNLGHTFGHAIEAELGFGTWLHGEAVAAGMVIAAKVAQAKGWMEQNQVARIESLVERFALPTSKPEQMTYEDFMGHMQHDKKVQSGQIRFIIPKGIGRAVVTADVDDAILQTVLN